MELSLRCSDFFLINNGMPQKKREMADKIVDNCKWRHRWKCKSHSGTQSHKLLLNHRSRKPPHHFQHNFKFLEKEKSNPSRRSSREMNIINSIRQLCESSVHDVAIPFYYSSLLGKLNQLPQGPVGTNATSTHVKLLMDGSSRHKRQRFH